MNKGYETGSKITYEPRSKTVIVNFRGRVTALPGPFDTESAAMNTAEGPLPPTGLAPGAAAQCPQGGLAQRLVGA